MQLQYIYIGLIIVFSGLSIYFYKELNKERKDNKENKRLLKKSFNFLNGYSQIQHNSENEFAKVVENFDIQDPEEFEVFESEDTLSILDRYIQEAEIQLDKPRLQNIMRSTYQEACELI